MADEKGRGRITRSSLGELAGLMARHKRALAIGFLALILVDLIQLLIPRITQSVIDTLAQGTAAMSSLWLLGGALIGVSLAMGLCRFVWRYFLIGTSHRIERDLRRDFTDHLLTLSPQFFDSTKVGDLMAHATNDISAVRMATGFAALASLDAIVLAVASLSIMLAMNASLTLLVLLPLPLLTFFMLRFGRIIHHRFTIVQETFSRLTERAQESFSGIRVVKSYGDEASEGSSFADRAEDCARANIHMARTSGLFDPMISALATGSTAILLAAGGVRVIRGEISLGQFVAMSGYLQLLIWPMLAVGWVVNMLTRGTASLERLRKLMTMEPDVRDGAVSRPPLRPAIEVRGLTFRYPVLREGVDRGGRSGPDGSDGSDGSNASTGPGGSGGSSGSSGSHGSHASTGSDGSTGPDGSSASHGSHGSHGSTGPDGSTGSTPASAPSVLHDISFDLPPGKTLGILGRTGSGKTTLIEVLMRLYDPPRGAVFVDGVDVLDLRLDDLRALYSYVPQETFLFAQSIAENIGFGLDELPRAEVERLGRLVQIHDEVAGFPEGYDTIVGERGVTLSGGQKQRIALARALAVRAPVLVLDDALSSVDTETEATILENLQVERAAHEREVPSRVRENGFANGGAARQEAPSRMIIAHRTSTPSRIIIAHRTSTLRRADLILVLDEGRLVERGTHDELLALGGLYFELHRMQQLEEEARRRSEEAHAEGGLAGSHEDGSAAEAP